jgi:hypothetical protein
MPKTFGLGSFSKFSGKKLEGTKLLLLGSTIGISGL